MVTANFRFEAGWLTSQVQNYVEGLIKQDDSPEQIVGISKKNHVDCVSMKRIYQHLRRKGRRYQRGSGKVPEGNYKDRVSMEQRPATVEKRSRFGIWRLT